MLPKVTTTQGTINFAPFDTRHHKGLLLSGGRAFKGSNRLATLLLQALQTDNFLICLLHIEAHAKTAIHFEMTGFPLVMLAALQTDIHLKMTGQWLSLRTGQCCLITEKKEHADVKLEKKKNYQVFSVFYTNHLYDQIQPLIKPCAVETISIPYTPLWISNEVKGVIGDILHCPFDTTLRELFYDNKVRDLLFYILLEHQKPFPVLEQFSNEEIQKLYQVRSLILEDITQHLTIADLSAKVNLNTFKLKIGFKQLFGTGPFSLLKHARLDAAHDYLQKTDRPIKEIAALAGYNSLTSFVGAFRKRFDKTPGDVRYKEK